MRGIEKGSGTSLLTATNFLVVSISLVSVAGWAGLFRTGLYKLAPDLFFSGGYYVIFTNDFLHAGLSHLFFNVLLIYVFGNLVEERIGALRTLGVYTAGSLVSGILWVFTMNKPAVGASDSVFALLAAAIVLTPRKRITSPFPLLDGISKAPLIRNLTTVLGVSALVQILALLGGFVPLPGITQLTGLLVVFDPFTQIVTNIGSLGSNQQVAHISHVAGLFAGGITSYILDSGRTLGNLKIFAFYALFMSLIYLKISSLTVLGGFVGLVALTYYITPEEFRDEYAGET